jgi:hypothetical protein
MDVGQFRNRFPEFACPEKYPVPMIELWAEFAVGLLNEGRLGSSYARAVDLFTAHLITVARQNLTVAELPGGIPGQVQGMVTSERVGDLATSFDVSALSNPADGEWNRSTYGQLLAMLIRVKGAGWAYAS